MCENLFLSFGGRAHFFGQVPAPPAPSLDIGLSLTAQVCLTVVCSYCVFQTTAAYCMTMVTTVMMCAMRVSSAAHLLSSTAATALVTGRTDYGQPAIFKQLFSRKHMHLMLLLNRG